MKPLWWMALNKKPSLSLKIGLVLNPKVEMVGASLGSVVAGFVFLCFCK